MADRALKMEEVQGSIALVTFDAPESKVNTFCRPVLEEWIALVGTLEKRQDLRGLLLRSGKPGQFIAGADLKELAALAHATPEQVKEASAVGHALFTRISNLPFPTVALVEGPCMGGGTELILAMDERLAAADSVTKISLPEVKIGIIPGWGGTQRLPRLVGVQKAIEMITSGEQVSGTEAARFGLVFDAVPPQRLVEEGCRLIEILHQDGLWRSRRERRSGPVGLSPDQMAFTFAIAQGMILAQTQGNYPAPLAALKAIQQGVNLPLEQGLERERAVSLEVMGTPISANLIGVFFMDSRLRRDPGVADPAIVPRSVGRVGVLGAGLMGAGIAAVCARSDIPAVMVDVSGQRLADGMQRIRQVVEKRIQNRRAKPEDLVQLLCNLATSTAQQAMSDCDVVVEAVTEKEDLKTQIYNGLKGILGPKTILASNTSTISVTRMAAAAPCPQRFVGMHFFYPVEKMPLVEVIRGKATDDETVATIVALAKRIRKVPIVVQDCAGFLVNRILMPYMNEALVLLGQGAPMDQIDKAATRWGMPMGPIALHDFVGLDTCYFAGTVMQAAYGDRTVPTPILKALVDAGRLGRKSGAGFRAFDRKGRPQADPGFAAILNPLRTDTKAPSDQEITDRLFGAMLLEAARALEEQIVRDPGDVDMGLILGIGFPAFRGGILRWCDQEGAAALLARLEPYRGLGKRFEPPRTLVEMARGSAGFYPRPRLVSALVSAPGGGR